MKTFWLHLLDRLERPAGERENITMRLCWGFSVYVIFSPKHPVYGIFRLKINGVQKIEGGGVGFDRICDINGISRRKIVKFYNWN